LSKGRFSDEVWIILDTLIHESFGFLMVEPKRSRTIHVSFFPETLHLLFENCLFEFWQQDLLVFFDKIGNRCLRHILLKECVLDKLVNRLTQF